MGVPIPVGAKRQRACRRRALLLSADLLFFGLTRRSAPNLRAAARVRIKL